MTISSFENQSKHLISSVVEYEFNFFKMRHQLFYRASSGIFCRVVEADGRKIVAVHTDTLLKVFSSEFVARPIN